jgi:predicted restriction endonuclease
MIEERALRAIAIAYPCLRHWCRRQVDSLRSGLDHPSQSQRSDEYWDKQRSDEYWDRWIELMKWWEEALPIWDAMGSEDSPEDSIDFAGFLRFASA